MPTTDERDAAEPVTEASRRTAARDEAARARAYLDLWERHLSQSAIDGPIEARSPLPA